MVTPVRRQYLDLKARHPDAILLFRLGDFYETFDEDAKVVSEALDIALTSKPMGGGLRSPLAGVPVRSVEQHLTRLVAQGHRVAICEQLEQPRAAKGLVKRGVVRVVSPGTALEPALLEAGQASACAAVAVRRERRRLRLGVAVADITTGACHVAELDGQLEEDAALWQRAADLLERLGARELLIGEGSEAPLIDLVDLALTRRPDSEFRGDTARRALEEQYGAPAAALGLEGERGDTALGALGALIGYLRRALPANGAPVDDLGDETTDETTGAAQPRALPHLSAPRWFETEAYLQWDRATERALGVTAPGSAAGSTRGSAAAADAGAQTLLEVIDRCGSAPGRRWLRAAVASPLLELERIERRLDRVEALVRRPALRRALAAQLRGAADLERLFGRASSGVASAAELARLARGLIAAVDLAATIEESTAGSASPALERLAGQLAPAPAAAERIDASLEERPAEAGGGVGGGVVRAGVDPEVDSARAASAAARELMAARERELREQSGIESLRIGYHRTFGYHIELTRSVAGRAPEAWERRQSLRDRERFSEPGLRRIETELQAAEERLEQAERDCVERLRRSLVAQAETVRRAAGALARLDAAASLAAVAAERAWSRPSLEHSGVLDITAGRHPIVEAAAAQGGFVPNDLRLADDGQHAPQLLLVTGPNMAGKSTYLRQAALIVILAQAGSFVPAERARVGLVDRIFARVGAHDELARGRSTFMVEMLETAHLLHGATDRSLVLLDEIGRGTSTWDGLAIAQAVAEALGGGPAAACPDARTASAPPRSERGPRTLFATHFHELTALAGRLPRVANAAVQVEETEAGRIEFLYRITPGAADRSYGVHVAAQAGLPAAVVARARELLEQLERPQGRATGDAGERAPQLMLMPPAPPAAHPLLHDLADVDVDGITPLEAISALYALREQARAELRGLQPERPARRAEAGS
ncbi:MAG: DNA mismatch repair protein MutS [Chloroflexi bacterium]|nr:DNA mismatch repair protein MutS [Chloroflexota bacterium]MCY3588599.1 DNA mismatch repair protein MutS [Chloroflexota bacterium]MDE2708545.1 DNA mismatch repair protein MutS [Chloroflexota bacterium]